MSLRGITVYGHVTAFGQASGVRRRCWLKFRLDGEVEQQYESRQEEEDRRQQRGRNQQWRNKQKEGADRTTAQ
jgi:hypothetical protein